MEAETEALIERITTQPPTRDLNAAAALALGWTIRPSTSGWKVVEPTGFVGGMVVPPRADTTPAEVWFDPDGRERGGLVGRTEKLPAFLTSLDAALGAAPAAGRADLLRRALDRHARWQADAGKDDPLLGRLAAFVIAEVLRAR